MRIVYDSTAPKEKRVSIEGDEGQLVYIQAYKILLDDGKELAEISRWGNIKRRTEIIKAGNKLLAENP